MRFTSAAAFLVVALAGPVSVAAAEDAGRVEPAASDRWDRVKLAVARDNVGSHVHPFQASLSSWADERYWRVGEGPYEYLALEGDATEELSVGTSVVHIRGNLATLLQVGANSQVVIGGSVTRDARIEAEGIVHIHVEGDVDGDIACHGMAGVWIGGDHRGQVLTGPPSMSLHVAGDLEGTVRPLVAGLAGLTVDVGGHAATSLLVAIDENPYVTLDMAVASSDELDEGVYPLWSGSHGFLAVTGQNDP